MILLPTLNRIAKLTVCVKSAVDAGTTVPALVLVDHDDYAANQAHYQKLENTAFPEGWRLCLTESRGMGAKVREVWPRVRALPFVGILNDDHKIITQNWDKRLIKQLNGKNFVSCQDNYTAPSRAAGATLWSMPLLECVNWPIFPPQIEHLGIDDCWELLGRATGCWRVDLSVVVEHQRRRKRILSPGWRYSTNWNSKRPWKKSEHLLK